jgi:hypothetical protein
MSAMDTVDENGRINVTDGSLTPIESDHPVWKARNALALGQGQWLYAPLNGHDLAKYENVKATESKIQEFEKTVQFYLQSYGPQVQDRFAKRGALSIKTLITRETISG